ncbi:MAG: OmpA family protein [Pirellulales bacterium]|nr:OmpA family protein [Pirellulales bacterium]
MPEDEPPAGAPEWIVTYGDMMSLLLTFFVLLFSMSEVKEEQSKALMESLRRQFGYDKSLQTLIAGPNMPMNSALAKLASMGRSRRLDTMRGGDKVRAPVGENARVWAIRPSDDATMGGAVYFAEGAADLDPESKQVLGAIAEDLVGKPQKIEIRGHTTRTPLPSGSPYQTHWDLAYARCVRVMEQLVALGIEPQRLRLAVAGEFEPVHISADPAFQKKNSRVEVLMLNELVKDLQGTPDEKRAQLAPP